VFAALVTARGQAWADFDVYMPDRWARDMPRRRAAGIPGDLDFATKPQLAARQLGRLTAAGLPVMWVAFDQVYGRSEELRKKAAKASILVAMRVPADLRTGIAALARFSERNPRAGGRRPGGDAGPGGVRGEPGPGRGDGVPGVSGGATSWSCPVCAGADGGGVPCQVNVLKP
jgi:SRSO17 transposase